MATSPPSPNERPAIVQMDPRKANQIALRHAIPAALIAVAVGYLHHRLFDGGLPDVLRVDIGRLAILWILGVGVVFAAHAPLQALAARLCGVPGTATRFHYDGKTGLVYRRLTGSTTLKRVRLILIIPFLVTASVCGLWVVCTGEPAAVFVFATSLCVPSADIYLLWTFRKYRSTDVITGDPERPWRFEITSGS